MRLNSSRLINIELESRQCIKSRGRSRKGRGPLRPIFRPLEILIQMIEIYFLTKKKYIFNDFRRNEGVLGKLILRLVGVCLKKGQKYVLENIFKLN